MESFLALFVHHDTYVVSFLVVGITIVVVLLLLFSQKSPESVVKSELGGADNVEGALRRVLGEQRWMQAGTVIEGGGADPEKLGALEQEVLEKDRAIAELNKQLTQSGSMDGGGGASGGDNSDLLNRISELEARLEEYEIIEDDIADLSLYKNENEKLKIELERLKGLAGLDVVKDAPASSASTIVEEDSQAPESRVSVAEDETSTEEVGGADLVAEFAKVVGAQEEERVEEASSRVSIKNDVPTGSVLMTGEHGSKKVTGGPIEVHPKLRSVNPDSKEEAEVFISELKSLKSIKKGQ